MIRSRPFPRFLCLLPLIAGLAWPLTPRLSVEFLVEALPLPAFMTVSNDLSRYLSVVRRSEARTSSFGGLVPYGIADLETTDLRSGTIRGPVFALSPAWVGLGARAHLRLSPYVGLLAESVFALCTDRKEGLQKWYLTEPGSTTRWLGTLHVQARDQGSGTAAVFSLGARVQHPSLRFLSIQPYLQVDAGGGPLIGYTTTTRLLAIVYENWVGGGPTAFTNLQQQTLNLVHTLSDDITAERSVSGALGRLQAKLGFAFAVGPKLTARLELGVQAYWLWTSAVRLRTTVNRGEFATSGVLIDPVTYLPTDYLDYPGTAVETLEAASTVFAPAFCTTLALERRF